MSRSKPLFILLATTLAAGCGSNNSGDAAKTDAAKTDAAKTAKTDTAKAVGEAKAGGGGIDTATATKLAQATRALASVSAAQRPLLAGAALAEVEVGRLPPPLVEAFGAMKNAPPDTRSLLAMKALTDPALLPPLQELCDGKGADVLSRAAQVAPEEKLPLIWDGCGLERAGLVTLAEAKTASIGELVLAHVARQLLLGKDGPTADETELLRAFVLGTGAAH